MTDKPYDPKEDHTVERIVAMLESQVAAMNDSINDLTSQLRALQRVLASARAVVTDEAARLKQVNKT